MQMFVYVVQCELPGVIICYHTVALERQFGIFCFCVEALVLIMSVLTCPNFVNTVMNVSSIKRRKCLYQISNFQLQNE